MAALTVMSSGSLAWRASKHFWATARSSRPHCLDGPGTPRRTERSQRRVAEIPGDLRLREQLADFFELVADDRVEGEGSNQPDQANDGQKAGVLPCFGLFAKTKSHQAQQQKRGSET